MLTVVAAALALAVIAGSVAAWLIGRAPLEDRQQITETRLRAEQRLDAAARGPRTVRRLPPKLEQALNDAGFYELDPDNPPPAFGRLPAAAVDVDALRARKPDTWAPRHGEREHLRLVSEREPS